MGHFKNIMTVWQPVKKLVKPLTGFLFRKATKAVYGHVLLQLSDSHTSAMHCQILSVCGEGVGWGSKVVKNVCHS